MKFDEVGGKNAEINLGPVCCAGLSGVDIAVDGTGRFSIEGLMAWRLG
jgi:hypothetical protein